MEKYIFITGGAICRRNRYTLIHTRSIKSGSVRVDRKRQSLTKNWKTNWIICSSRFDWIKGVWSNSSGVCTYRDVFQGQRLAARISGRVVGVNFGSGSQIKSDGWFRFLDGVERREWALLLAEIDLLNDNSNTWCHVVRFLQRVEWGFGDVGMYVDARWKKQM